MRVVFVITRRCMLRCPYCIVKKNHQDMSSEIVDRAIAMTLESDHDECEIHFFGGEPLLAKDEIVRAVERAEDLVSSLNKKVSFIISTNCELVDDSFAEWASKKPFLFELSVDGSRADYPGDEKTKKDIFLKAAEGVGRLIARSQDCFVTTVVTPETVSFLSENVAEIYELGVRKLNISPATGIVWPNSAINDFSEQLMKLHDAYFKPRKIELLNLNNKVEEMLINREICVDCDGTVYAGNAFLYSTEEAASHMVVGHVSDMKPASFYAPQAPPLSFYIENVFTEDITLSYYQIIKIIRSYRKYYYDNC